MSEENQLTTVNTSSAGLVMSRDSMGSMLEVAKMMATSTVTVPKHLQGKVGDCMAVTMQAMQWGMNPFAVAQKTHVVNGTLGYEAQLVNAAVQASGAIVGRFHYEYRGASPKLECRVGAIIAGESEIVWGQWLCEDRVTTKNSPLWKTNVQQQLGYLQVKNWSRAYCPGAILGVYTPDELEEIPAQSKNMGAVEIVEEAGYIAYKQEFGALLNDAASNGSQALKAAFSGLAKSQYKAKLWEECSASLKAVAAAADEAKATPVEVKQEPVKATEPVILDDEFVRDMGE